MANFTISMQCGKMIRGMDEVEAHQQLIIIMLKIRRAVATPLAIRHMTPNGIKAYYISLLLVLSFSPKTRIVHEYCGFPWQFLSNKCSCT